MESIKNSRIEKIRVVREYHGRTKHRLDRYAASPGYMDWENQPNPFRVYAEARSDLNLGCACSGKPHNSILGGP